MFSKTEGDESNRILSYHVKHQDQCYLILRMYFLKSLYLESRNRYWKIWVYLKLGGFFPRAVSQGIAPNDTYPKGAFPKADFSQGGLFPRVHFPEVIFPKGDFSQGGLFLRGTFPKGTFPKDTFPKVTFPIANCKDDNNLFAIILFT